ncbi:hypothetical protein NDU88_001410 [Pleurodeles waltl]|uniref:Uncharacterized protein n=1 Tax=Pleurodeles waltl TaxID=8319 RepID=A0AAV7S9U7_PLEWA|nr:hypothetical protein NDU88_001410 [Pleurodeles waltl]
MELIMLTDEYVEEETISVLLIDSKFCKAVDASVHHAVASQPSLWKDVCSNWHIHGQPLLICLCLLKDRRVRNSQRNAPEVQDGERAEHVGVRQAEAGIRRAPPSDTLQGDPISILPSGDAADDGSQDSNDEAGPSRPWS